MGDHERRRRPMDPEEAENLYLQQREENMELKKKIKDQEERQKRMTTKLVRITADLKRKHEEDGTGRKGFGEAAKVDDLLEENRELARRNDLLQNKLKFLALNKKGDRPISGKKYPGVSARTDSNFTRGRSPARKENSGNAFSPTRSPSINVADDVRTANETVAVLRQKLLEANNHISGLQNDILILNRQMARDEASSHEGKRSEAEYEELQQQLKRRNADLKILENRYNLLEANFNRVKDTDEQLAHKTDEVHRLLSDERRHTSQLRAENSSLMQRAESCEKINALLTQENEENRIARRKLEEENKSLVDDLFTGSGLKDKMQRKDEELAKLRHQVEGLEEQNSQFATRVKNAEGRLKTLMDENRQLLSEKENSEKDDSKIRQELRDLQAQMDEITENGRHDLQTIRRALLVVRRHDEGKLQSRVPSRVSSSTETIELEGDIKRLKLENKELVLEVERLTRLLKVQEHISLEREGQVAVKGQAVDEVQARYSEMYKEEANKVALRDARIAGLQKQLEAFQLHQVRQVQRDELEKRRASLVDTHSTPRDGRNAVIFQIHSLVLEQTHFNDSHPMTFMTVDWFVHDTQNTNYLAGLNPAVDFHREFVIKVDEFFLNYIETEVFELELYQTNGDDYNLVATCNIPCDNLHKSTMEQKQALLVSTDAQGTMVGSLTYTIYMQASILDAVKAYRASPTYKKPPARPATSARSSMHSRESVGTGHAAAVAKPRSFERREVTVEVVSCSGLVAPREGQLPSAFVIYQFLDFPARTTEIQQNTADPVFYDRRTYPLLVTSAFEESLLTKKLELSVMDDKEEDADFYYGTATFSLAPLVQEKPVSGAADLMVVDRDSMIRSSGQVQVRVSWTQPTPLVSPDSPEINKEALRVMAKLFKRSGLSLKTAFVALNSKGDGYIGWDEWREAVDTLSLGLSLEQSKSLFHHIDSKNDNRLDFDEFSAALSPHGVVAHIEEEAEIIDDVPALLPSNELHPVASTSQVLAEPTVLQPPSVPATTTPPPTTTTTPPPPTQPATAQPAPTPASAVAAPSTVAPPSSLQPEKTSTKSSKFSNADLLNNVICDLHSLQLHDELMEDTQVQEIAVLVVLNGDHVMSPYVPKKRDLKIDFTARINLEAGGKSDKARWKAQRQMKDGSSKSTGLEIILMNRYTGKDGKPAEEELGDAVITLAEFIETSSDLVGEEVELCEKEDLMGVLVCDLYAITVLSAIQKDATR